MTTNYIFGEKFAMNDLQTLLFENLHFLDINTTIATLLVKCNISVTASRASVRVFMLPLDTVLFY